MCCPREGDREQRRGVRVTVVSTISTQPMVADDQASIEPYRCSPMSGGRRATQKQVPQLRRKAGVFTDLSPPRLSRVCVDDLVCGAVQIPFNWQTEATPHRLELCQASSQ